MPTTIETLEERVRLTIAEHWPDLPDADAGIVGLDVERLSELLQQQGMAPDEARSQASDAFARALLPAQAGNAGWVQLLDDGEEQRLGRGQLMLLDTSPDSPGQHLAGAITHLHLEQGVSPIGIGSYRIRFEENGETRPVQAVCPQDAVLPESVAIAFLDEGLPITVSELSSGE